MEIIDKILFPPRHDHILVSDIIIVFVSLIYLLYLSFLTGATMFSVGFLYRGRTEENPFYVRLSKDLISLAASSLRPGLLLGVLPVLALALAYAQVFQSSELEVARFFEPILLATLIGAVLAFLYRISLEKSQYLFLQLLLGVLAVLSLLAAAYAFLATSLVSLYPEKWMFLEGSIPHLFDAVVFVRFLHFLVLVLAVTGISVLYLNFNFGGGRENLEPAYRDYLLKFGGGLGLAGTLLQPIFIVWSFYIFPPFAESMPGYYVAVGSVTMLFLLSLVLYLLLAQKKASLGTLAYLLLVLATLLILVDDTVARKTAMHEYYLALAQQAQAFEESLVTEREKLRGPGVEVSLALGEQIYQTRCSSCHAFDRRVVGPPHKDVLPKYVDNPEALVEFILNPVKVNPDYPIMPNLGLKRAEAESVARYLLEKFKEFQKQGQGQ